MIILFMSLVSSLLVQDTVILVWTRLRHGLRRHQIKIREISCNPNTGCKQTQVDQKIPSEVVSVCCKPTSRADPLHHPRSFRGVLSSAI